MSDKRNPDDTARTSQPDVNEGSELRDGDDLPSDRSANPERRPHGHVPDENEERFDAG